MNTELHIICGLPCSGKSTLAKKLEVDLPGLRLGPDEWLVDLIPDRNQEEVGRQRPILNSIQWKLAQRVLSLGCNVILEHGFWSPQERLEAAKGCANLNVKIHLHYMNVAMSVLGSRLDRRNQNLPNDCFYIAPKMLEQWAPDFVPPDSDELELFNSYQIYEPEI
tara:strand:+ start:415 stop:909 length:495 start_codon:yes stop_codon:yes gene_type:complete